MKLVFISEYLTPPFWSFDPHVDKYGNMSALR